MIEWIEIEIGEILARQIADGQAFSSFDRRQQCVTREIVQHKFLLVAIVDDGVNEPQCSLVINHTPESGFEDLVVYSGKLFFDITLEDISIFSEVILVPANGLVRTLAFAVGIGIMDKSFLQNRPNDIDECMMHNTIAKRCCADLTLFGLINIKGTIVTRFVCAMLQLIS